MLSKKRELIVIWCLLSMLFPAFITPLYADAAELSVSVAVKPKLIYDDVYNNDKYAGFTEGLAPVARKMKDGKMLWGYIDALGKEVIPCKFDYVYPFYKGMAKFAERNDDYTSKYGLIDKTGKIVVPAKYDAIEEINNMDINGLTFGEFFSEGFATVRIGDKYGYVDKSGKEVTSCKYDVALHFSDGRARVIQNGRYGYIDTAGNEVVPLIYGNAQDFSEGYAWVNPDYSETKIGDTIYLKPGKWGTIDKDGNEVIPPKYDEAGGFSDGLAPVNLEGSWPIGSSVGTSIVMYSGGLWGLVDTKGNEVVPLQYSDMTVFSEGLLAVESDRKWGFIDSTGRQVIEPKYDDYWIYGFINGMVKVSINQKYGIIDKTGNEVVPIKYDDVGDFSNGFVQVCINDKWGYVDIDGKEVIPPKYDFSDNFNDDGVAVVGLKDRSFCIDTSGKVIAEVTQPKGWTGRYEEGLCSFCVDGRYGFLDITGKVVVQPQYDSVSNFFGGLSLVEKDGKYGILKLNKTTNNSEGSIAKPISASVFVDGKGVTFEAYGINGNNYFKLRDIAMALSGSGKQFDVAWDAEKNSVTLTYGKAYAPVGGELGTPNFQMVKDAKPTASKFNLDEKEIRMTVYLIEDSNYIKLRDLGKALDFGVKWDEAANAVLIDTSIQYIE